MTITMTDAGPDPMFVAELVSEVRSTTGDHFATASPISGERIAEIPRSSGEDVAEAFAAAHRAQSRWAAMTAADRGRILLRFHDLVLAHRDEGLDLVQWETGKARKDALEELLDVCVTARYYARGGPRMLRPRRIRGIFPGVVGVTQYHQPKGVVGVIAPWNYPLTLAVSDAIPALMAGNTVVVKPDTQTTLTALWVLHLLHRAGMPRGVLEVVAGEGVDLGPAVTGAADYVMFTGSTRVGRIIAEQCGQRLIGCSLELGGKNAMIVRADVDVDRAVETAIRATFANSGQLCVSMERMYIDQAVWDRFVPRFADRVRAMRVRVGLGWDSDMGSLISQRQLQAVATHVDDARARGVTVLAGGTALPEAGPYAFAPTVLTGVTEDMVVCRNETFGPVVSLYPVAGDDEAVRAANDTEYGLNASVLTGSLRAGVAVARQVRAGTVNVNEGYAAAWGSTRAPMGGMKASGLGRRHGEEGLLKYTESQSVAVQRIMGFGPPFGWSDRTWGESLTLAVKSMKRLGVT
ncbi:MAG: succinic semialdehyde dehydrogenase [Candidatus Nanopelagicales bacterium]